MFAIFFAMFMALVCPNHPHHNGGGGTVTTQDDTGGETGHVPTKPPR